MTDPLACGHRELQIPRQAFFLLVWFRLVIDLWVLGLGFSVEFCWVFVFDWGLDEYIKFGCVWLFL